MEPDRTIDKSAPGQAPSSPNGWRPASETETAGGSSSAAQCCDKVYFCPTSGETECPVHGGFDVCCDRPDLHRPVASAARDHRRENRLVWIQVALCIITGTAMIWGAFAHIGWLFWGLGLPVAILTLIYGFIAAAFIQLWAKERHGA